MKHFLIGILLLIPSLVFSADLITYDKVESTTGVSFDEEATGSWQAIELPSTVENVRHVYIQVNDGSGTIADTTEGFLLSFDSDGSEYAYIPETGITLSIGKKAGEVLFYIKATASTDITVTGLR